MRLCLHLEFNTSEKENALSNWIDRLKEKRSEEEKKEADRQKALQRKDEILRAKLPDFLRETSKHVGENVIQLREAFPNEAQYDLKYSPEDAGFSLLRQVPFARQLRFAFDRTRILLVVLLDEKKLGHERAINQQLSTLVSLDMNDNLVIEFQGQRFYQPDGLAEAAVKLTAEIR